MGPRVRLGLNVGATEREVTEEVGFEALVSSLTDSAVDVFIDLETPTEGKTVVALLAHTRVRLLPSRTRMNQESMLTESGAGRDRWERGRRLRLDSAAASRPATSPQGRRPARGSELRGGGGGLASMARGSG